MDSFVGLLRICVKRGVNLAVRDVRTSDPYVVVKLGKQVGSLTLLNFVAVSFSVNFVESFSRFLLSYVWGLKGLESKTIHRILVLIFLG